jgi:hypothetical protein
MAKSMAAVVVVVVVVACIAVVVPQSARVHRNSAVLPTPSCGTVTAVRSGFLYACCPVGARHRSAFKDIIGAIFPGPPKLAVAVVVGVRDMVHADRVVGTRLFLADVKIVLAVISPPQALGAFTAVKIGWGARCASAAMPTWARFAFLDIDLALWPFESRHTLAHVEMSSDEPVDARLYALTTVDAWL